MARYRRRRVRGRGGRGSARKRLRRLAKRGIRAGVRM